MAHFAHIGADNIVKGVYRFYDEADGSSPEPADIGDAEAGAQAFFSAALPGWVSGDFVKKTSYNGTMRKNYAGIGHTWDAGRDAFIEPCPGPGWVLNEDTCRWEQP